MNAKEGGANTTEKGARAQEVDPAEAAGEYEDDGCANLHPGTRSSQRNHTDQSYGDSASAVQGETGGQQMATETALLQKQGLESRTLGKG